MGPTAFRARAQASGTTAETVGRARGPRMDHGATEVLRGVGLLVGRDEVFALPWPDGEGGTSTVGILEGFRGRSAGEVEVRGQDPRCRDGRPGTSRVRGSGPCERGR